MAPYGQQNGLMRIGYSVDEGGETDIIADQRLPLLPDADLKDKIVLLRVDHNVVKKGEILDQYRIDVTLPTLYNITERGGRPILMTHIGRPYDKKTKTITIRKDESVDAVVAYLQRKLRIKFVVPKFHYDEKDGILDIDTSINWLITDLRKRKIGGIYLPNTRWFAGEEDKGEKLERFVIQLAGLADVFVNDAFGSWQPHGSTCHITKYLPSYAGLCMQDELYHVEAVLNPTRPFIAIVAGSKYDTKIGPLNQIYKKVDKLVLGGVIYNTYLCAKYGVKIAGVQDSDIELAKELVEQDKAQGKIVEMDILVETDTLSGRFEGQYRAVSIKDFAPGKTYNYIVDIDPLSLESENVLQALNSDKHRYRMELHGIGKAPQRQEMGTTPFSREELGRRPMLMFPLLGLGIESFIESLKDKTAIASDFADMPALRGKDYGKTKMRYPDYTETESGLQYKDLRKGDGPMPKIGDLVVVDWDGYTIGYYGRIFEARNKSKGGSFEGYEKDYFKFRLGSKQVIPAFEEAIASMAVGGIRRVIVPPELGYPGNDFNNAGPRPTTFSGERALDFVLKNQGLIDKTLLFDIELLKVISA